MLPPGSSELTMSYVFCELSLLRVLHTNLSSPQPELTSRLALPVFTGSTATCGA
jgi:hypothetical protein